MNATRTTLIRPGLLVSLKSTITGGVQYQKRTIEAEHAVGERSSEATWETTRVVADVEEHAAAVVARGKARAAVTGVCCASTFGLLCPDSNESKLWDAIATAQAIADEHNAKALYTRVEVFALCGRVSDSDVSAARAIGAEVRDLIDRMEEGIRKADPEAIRDAASKARAVSGMLTEDAQRKVGDAIKEARSVARALVAKVEKAGETAASVVDGLKLEAINGARFAVLDLLSDGTPDLFETVPTAGRAIDFEPAPAANDEPAELAAAPAIEL